MVVPYGVAPLGVVFGLWMVWNLIQTYFTTPAWFLRLVATGLGVAAMLILDKDRWWLGVGLAGATEFLVLMGDLLLVTTDAVRRGLLSRMRGR